MKQDEFDKLTVEQKEQFLANAETLRKNQEEIDKADAGKKKLSMDQFEGMVEEKIRKMIEPMTKVDRKYFAFPGIGKVDDDVSAEGKFAKTSKFFKALACGDVVTARGISEEARKKANLSEGSATGGGYLVPDEFKNEIQRLAPEYGVIRREARIIPMRRDVIYIPGAGATNQSAIWTNEAAQILQTNPNFEQLTLTVKKLAAIPKVTNELLADADVDTVSYLSQLIAEAFAKEEDNQAFLGTGSPFIGVCESTGSPSRAVSSGTISAMTYADLVLSTGDIYTNAIAGSKYYFHRSVIALMRSLVTTAGAPLFPPSLESAFGYPVIATEMLRSISDMGASDGTCFGIFGNLRRGYAFAERGSITMAMSTDATVDSDNLFEKDMVALRMIERISMGVLLPSCWVKLTT